LLILSRSIKKRGRHRQFLFLIGWFKRIGTKLAFFIKDFPRMLPTKFWFILPSGFRGDNFLEINQSETRIAFGGHVCQRIGTKLAFFIKDFPRMLHTKFDFFHSQISRMNVRPQLSWNGQLCSFRQQCSYLLTVLYFSLCMFVFLIFF
jgi:hypothetical protein